MDLLHRCLKPDDPAPQPTPLQDQPFLRPNLNKADTATQLTSNNNSITARAALTAASGELEVTKQLAKVTKAANTGVTKLLGAITMATTRHAADGAATTEDINDLANYK
jgi:hypothetical protein